ncbi:hypothetical protein SEUCBS139899_004502 [Sporothrix eucalyptigena]
MVSLLSLLSGAAVAQAAAVIAPRASTTYPAIDTALTVSTPTATVISEIDTSKSTYDRLTPMVGGEPFFYNGIQLRADKLQEQWGMSDDAVAEIYQMVADAGYTHVISQISWLNIQPDSTFNATKSTYIRGGTSAELNFGTSTSVKIGYHSGDESNKMLTYVQFNFSSYTADDIDAARLRFYVNLEATSDTAFIGTLYGITDNSWDPSTMTWTSGAPNHDGVDVTGTLNGDYFVASSSPSWDLLQGVQYYDFDCSDFIKNHTTDGIASFVLQAQINATSMVGITMDSSRGTHPPQLVLSSKSTWDWTYLDKLLGWIEAAGLKCELIWFGTETTGTTMDTRVPYHVFTHTKNYEVASNGTVSAVMLKSTEPMYGVYWYYMDKNDLTLRALEKSALKTLFNYIGARDTANGSPKTVIGVEVANEPAFARFYGSAYTPWENPETWGRLSLFASVSDFAARTMWEFCVNLANGVKESDYPVWTRTNDYTSTDAPNIVYNELMRADTAVGTSLDFVGLDPYQDSRTFVYNFGHENFTLGQAWDMTLGKNLPVIMENGGSYSDAYALPIAALAGGSFYDVYEMYGPDDLGLYVPADETTGNYTPVARGSYVSAVIHNNQFFNKMAVDLATRQSIRAGGTTLDFYNVLGTNDDITGTFGSVGITYTEINGGAGVSIVRSTNELAIGANSAATFTLSGIVPYGIASVQKGAYVDNVWIESGSASYSTSGDNITIELIAYDVIRILTTTAV